MSSRTPRFSSRYHVVLIVMALSLGVAPSVARTQSEMGRDSQDIAKRFGLVASLQSDGQYDRVVRELRQIIDEFSDSEQVLREAHSRLVYAYHDRGDTDGARRAAAEALEKYPDLTVAGRVDIPPDVDSKYFDPLRKEMFGALSIKKEEGCSVFLDSLYVGKTPYFEPLTRAGQHELTLKKSGCYDYIEQIAIPAGGLWGKDVRMERPRGWTWWATRVGLPVAGTLVGIGIYALTRDDPAGPPPAPTPIGVPPPPP